MGKIIKKILLILVFLFIICSTFILYFNRIPKRIIPEGNVIVSPANGKVVDIKSSNNNEIEFFKNDIKNTLTISNVNPPFTIITIEMNLKNVHVQRAPVEGKITYEKHFDGMHKNALSSSNTNHLIDTNEKNLVVFENQNISVGVVQVAGILARRIRSFVNLGDTVKKGDIYGKIILGSQVVVILPKEAKITTSVGETLIDGESLIAKY